MRKQNRIINQNESESEREKVRDGEKTRETIPEYQNESPLHPDLSCVQLHWCITMSTTKTKTTVQIRPFWEQECLKFTTAVRHQGFGPVTSSVRPANSNSRAGNRAKGSTHSGAVYLLRFSTAFNSLTLQPHYGQKPHELSVTSLAWTNQKSSLTTANTLRLACQWHTVPAQIVEKNWWLMQYFATIFLAW